jgi:Tetracyclin repressor-like, C-terminal domain
MDPRAPGAQPAGELPGAQRQGQSGEDDVEVEGHAEGYAKLHQSLEQTAATTGDVGERLLRLGGAYVRFAQEHPDLFVTMFRSQPGAGAGHDSFDVLLRTVAEAQRAELILSSPSAELMARSIWATLHGLAVLSLRGPYERFGMDEPPEDLAATTLSTLLGLKAGA